MYYLQNNFEYPCTNKSVSSQQIFNEHLLCKAFENITSNKIATALLIEPTVLIC